MYKYKCAAAADAEKERFYSTVDELRELYPDIVEENGAVSDSGFLRREFRLREKRIMVQYSFSERAVTVFSEEWLGRFFEGKEVAEGHFPLASPTVTTGTMWAVSGAFSVVAAAVAFLEGYYNFYYYAIFPIILVLAAVYTVSGILIRRRIRVSLPKLTFWQAGGFITVIIVFITADLFLFDSLFYEIRHDTSILVPVMEIGALYLYVLGVLCVPALQISWLIQAIIGRAGKKVNTPNPVTEEKIAEN